MNKLAKYILTPLLIVGVGCSDFGDVDKSPDASETPLTSALLTNGLAALGGASAGGGSFSAGLYAQYFSETQYTDASLYADQDLNWSGELAGSLMDFQNIININSDPATAANAALAGSNANQIAIARIMKAYRFSILTDRYGDMPYFEALTGNSTPAFDSQQDIYNDIFKELDEAVSQFDSGPAAKGDILYGGDNTKWQKFANSFRLILALRVSDVNPTLGSQQFNDALNSPGGVFTSNDDNAILEFPGPPFNNPWFAIGADQGISETVANFVNANQDARRAVFGNPLSNGTLLGVPYGLTREQAIAWTAGHPGWSLILNDDYRQQTSTQFILTYADVLLARAEAALLGWAGTPADVDALYNQAIEQSWMQWGVYDVSAYNAYITDADIQITDATPNFVADAPGAPLTTKEARVATQRWLTFYPNGAQGWSEWRRTGFPVLTPTGNAVNPAKAIPVRFQYPNVEYTYNAAGVEAAVARMGSDNDQTRVWWDVN
ncbi:MAG TPA: SusD/RagB family nutrient-binding outer membrane lipoprotein [Chryseosolibacter sp.]